MWLLLVFVSMFPFWAVVGWVMFEWRQWRRRVQYKKQQARTQQERELRTHSVEIEVQEDGYCVVK